ncbi:MULTISPECIES: YqjD family protein [Pandoraea]|uniref:DUF883 domain-containing protein n=1 Tax=Pandoraea communis TaxID=2508297 RepID=A0A5E4YGP5_9BURK|nr:MULTISPECIES: DUF883 family protein [Pandoraea]VVE47620.1 hypothetical protein PCO31110_04556 [Pandoraea communis]
MNDIPTERMNHRQTLIHDADALLADVKALLKDLADEANLEVGEATPALNTRLQQLTARLDTLRKAGTKSVSELAQSTDHYVHDHPWRSVLAAASVAAAAATAGAIVAPMIARRRRQAEDTELRL